MSTPAVPVLSVAPKTAVFGATDRTGTAGVDITGAVVQTTFKF